MHLYYAGKVAVVTGAASGIGLALGEGLLCHGAKIVVLADLNAEKLAVETARLQEVHPGRVFGTTTDVTQPESVAAMVRQAAEPNGGKVHFLFNNAGLGLSKPFDQTTEGDWQSAFEINFYGALFGIRAVLPTMHAQGGGHIVNTGSGIAFSPMAYQSMYSATKAALIALTSSLRYELWDEHNPLYHGHPGDRCYSDLEGQGRARFPKRRSPQNSPPARSSKASRKTRGSCWSLNPTAPVPQRLPARSRKRRG